MAVIAITGALASGKSAVLKAFKKKGAFVFDADKTIRSYYQDKNSVIYKKIKKAFPQAFHGARISREKLSTILYSDRNNKKLLEAIVHPVIIKDLLCWARAARVKNRLFFAEVPLLFEKGLDDNFDYTILVSAKRGILLERISKKYAITQKEAAKRLQYFIADSKKKKMVDFVIKNSLEYEFLQKEVELLWKKLNQKRKMRNR
jgi:dephospho-CoA kinase